MVWYSTQEQLPSYCPPYKYITLLRHCDKYAHALIPFVSKVGFIADKHDNDVGSSLGADVIYPL